MTHQVERSTFKVGASMVLFSTIIAGAAGYGITILLARFLASDYGSFAVYWSTLYLIIGALAGIQQEMSRSTSKRGGNSALALSVQSKQPYILSAVMASIGMFALLIIAANLLPLISIEISFNFYFPLALGAALWILISFLLGTLYGLQRWSMIAAILILDAVSRAALISIAGAMSLPGNYYTWIVVIPFVAILIVMAYPLKTKILGQSFIDVPVPRLIRNISKTLLAASAMSLIVSGFPIILAATSAGIEPQKMSAIVFAVLLTRAPLVMVFLSLQNYLIVYFRGNTEINWKLFARIFLGLFLAASVLAALVFIAGDQVIEFLAGPAFKLSAYFLALVTFSSCSAATLSITGAALVSLARHNWYTAGLVIAALATIALMCLPFDAETRTFWALFLGPLAGVFFHLFGMRSK